MNRPLRVVFMGSSDFAVPALERLSSDPRVDLMLCITQPDRVNKRGGKISYLPVKQKALDLGIEVYQPENLSTEGEDKLASLQPDLMVVAAYGQILKKNILDIAPLGVINIHGSILPHLRGAAPVHHAILGGDTESGVSIMLLDEGMDTGAILNLRRTSIDETTTVGELHDRLADMGADLLMDTLSGFVSGQIRPVPQDERSADYADKVTKDTGHVRWKAKTNEVVRQINGTDPFPGAYSVLTLADKPLKIKLFGPEAYAYKGVEKPGTILKASRKEGLLIKTADGAVRIGQIQFPGKKRMDTEVFFVGNTLPEGTILA